MVSWFCTARVFDASGVDGRHVSLADDLNNQSCHHCLSILGNRMTHLYLIVDGMLSGTGIRDGIEGGYIELGDLGLPVEFMTDFSEWLHRYENAHFEGFKNKSHLAALDVQGITLSKRLGEVLTHSKIEYFSSGEMRKKTN